MAEGGGGGMLAVLGKILGFSTGSSNQEGQGLFDKVSLWLQHFVMILYKLCLTIMFDNTLLQVHNVAEINENILDEIGDMVGIHQHIFKSIIS